MSKQTTVRLLQRDGVGEFREVEGDSYEPVEFAGWGLKNDHGPFIIYNKSPVEFPPAEEPWGEIEAVRVENGRWDMDIELDSTRTVKPSLLFGTPVVKFERGDLEMEVE